MTNIEKALWWNEVVDAIYAETGSKVPAQIAVYGCTIDDHYYATIAFSESKHRFFFDFGSPDLGAAIFNLRVMNLLPHFSHPTDVYVALHNAQEFIATSEFQLPPEDDSSPAP